ncbi:MAG TPA: hypothetical protein VFQ85_07955 [Mycobacteriales bacterium]|nr:hypothetical protein [Mycobacteriales bacterium]
MSFARLALAAAVLGAAVAPTAAHAIVEICAYPAPGVYVCHNGEQPGCERAGAGTVNVRTPYC